MKINKLTPFCSATGALAVALALLSAGTTARANVYATDIQVNGNLLSASQSISAANPVTITYHLNQLADLGCTVYISNSTPALVATIAGGTAMGLHSVKWGGTNNSGSAVATPGSVFTVSITASATGFPFWTQISQDSSPGNVAVYAHGIAIDNNPSSPYYGRVFVNNGVAASQFNTAQLIGIYKYNADATLADEGDFGDGNYTTNNSCATAVGQMVEHGGYGHGQEKMRVGTDDRLYMCDYSNDGSVVAFDPLVTTNQSVINQAAACQVANYPNTPSYDGSQDYSDLNNGILAFDVTGGVNPAVWLCDNDYPGWGVWEFQMKSSLGTADPADSQGTQAVYAGSGAGISLLISSGGCMIDDNLDIFVSALREGAGDPNARTMAFMNWNGGTLPPENTSFSDAEIAATWAVGAGDDTMSGIQDTVIDSRSNPKYVAMPMSGTDGDSAPVAGGYDGDNGGIRVLNAVDGSVVSVTNGPTIQTLTNIDFGNWYESAAWDNVGNLYATSTTTNYWRVWSPPGASMNTTVAAVQINAVAPVSPFSITSITSTPTTPGCANVTINFTCPGGLASTAFTVVGSSNIRGPYTAVASVTITGSGGAYQATFSNCSTKFYQIEHH